MYRTIRPARWRSAATIFFGAVLAFAVASTVLDGGRPAYAADDCQYGPYAPYGQPCPPGAPTLTTTPQPSQASLGWYLSDRATLSGGTNPTGTLTFRFYGPGDEACSNAVFTWQSSVYGNGDYWSGSYLADRSGTWRWTVAYSGDGQNQAVSSGCSEEPVTVTKATPTVYLFGSGTASIGSTLYANGYGYGAFQATGNATVGLYRPSDETCSGTPASSQAFGWFGSSFVSLWSTYGPADELGTWRYRVEYPGDANNEAASLPCGWTSVQVVKASPYVFAGVSPGAMTIGGQATVNGQVAYGYQPSGAVTVSFFAPNDPGCSSAVATSDAAIRPDGTFDTAFTPTSVGLWRMTASYAGDGFNNPYATWCGSMTVDVSKASPGVFPAASPTTAATGSRLQGFTLVQGGYQPAGRVAFRLYRPDDPTCAGLPAYIEEASVVSGAASTATGFVVPSEGTWRWQVVYLGDENNNGGTSGCDQAPVSVVARLGTPPREPGGTPFVTNVYFNCVDDHNIGVPYGSRLVLRIGFATKTEKQIKAFLAGVVTTAVVDGISVQNPDQYWGKPFLSSGTWTSRWEYDTGRVVTAYTQPFTIAFREVATKAGTDGFGTWNAGDVLLATGPCLVNGYQP
jgi:hypothetical protein